jgi:hypothetical protein
VPESCFHECPHCGKSWDHPLSVSTNLDTYFISCKECQKKYPVDVVAPLMKTQRRDADEDTGYAGEIVEKIARLIPDRAIREVELMDEEEKCLTNFQEL